MATGFKGTGAKVKHVGSRWQVVHGRTGKVLSVHGNQATAQKKAAETRARNATSTMRSAKNRNRHGK